MLHIQRERSCDAEVQAFIRFSHPFHMTMPLLKLRTCVVYGYTYVTMALDLTFMKVYNASAQKVLYGK